MKTRRLGKTELELSTVGLGTWAMGGGDWAYSWGPQDDTLSIRAIYRALDLGVNWLDTAPGYGLGHAETIVGRALKGMSHRPIVATKCGLVWNDEGKITGRLKRSSVLAEIEASLRRLQMDVLDLCQIHWPWPVEDIAEGWGAIAQAVKEGKVRHGGVSNFSVEQIQRVQPLLEVASLQPPYSMLAPEIETDLLPFCGAQGIGVIVYSPLQKGLLSGRLTRERVAQFPADDHRRNDSQFREPLLSANLELADGLRPIAQKCGRTVSQLAIAWTLRRPEVTCAIVGARQPAQIEETVGGADWTLSPADLAAIDECLQPRRARMRA